MNRFEKILPLALVLVLAAPCLASKESKEEDSESPALVETVEVIGHVALNRAVQSVTVHDEKVLQVPGSRGLKEIFSNTPGFLVLNGGHYGQMAYSFARGAAVNQTLFIIDGIKLNDPSSSLGLNLTMIPANLLERAEIVRGPLSGLYGSNAMGGVVSLTTRRDEGVSADAGFGNQGSWDAHVHAARNSGHWKLGLTAGLTRFKGDLNNDEFMNRGITARAMFEAGDFETGLQLFVHSAASGIPMYMGLASPNREYNQSSVIAALPITWKVDENTRVSLVFSHNTNIYEFNDPDDTWSPFYKNRSRINEAEASIAGVFLPNWHFRAGLDTAFHTIMNLTNTSAGLDNETSGYISAYAGTDMDLGRVLFTANLRMDKYRDVDTAWSPQLGASILITDQIKLRASWGESFRAPTLPERLNPSWGNPELQPETSRSLEAGADLYLNKLTLGIAVFDTRYKNLIGYSPLTWRYANLNEAVIKGVEVSASFRPVRGLELRSAWTWLDTEDKQYGRQLLRRPRHTLSAGFTWTHSLFTLGGDMIYVGKRLDYNELDWISPVVESPAFNTFSFRAMVPLTCSVAFHARVTNAFNVEYSEIYGYPAPGTRIMAGLRFKTK